MAAQYYAARYRQFGIFTPAMRLEYVVAPFL
jgi:hypothetical protein